MTSDLSDHSSVSLQKICEHCSSQESLWVACLLLSALLPWLFVFCELLFVLGEEKNKMQLEGSGPRLFAWVSREGICPGVSEKGTPWDKRTVNMELAFRSCEFRATFSGIPIFPSVLFSGQGHIVIVQ